MFTNRSLIVRRPGEDVRILHVPADVLQALVDFRDQIRRLVLDRDRSVEGRLAAVLAECDSIIVTNTDGSIPAQPQAPVQFVLERSPPEGVADGVADGVA